MKVRLIIMSGDNGEDEFVRFCDVRDTTPAADFCRPGIHVSHESIIAVDLPGFFPMNYDLKRE